MYLLVKGQCSPNIISELKRFDEFDIIEQDFHLIKLLKLIKKICYNNKTQEDLFFALVSAGGTLFSTRQRKDESTDEYALSTENRLQVYTTILGTILIPGVTEHVSQEQYGKGYEYLNTTTKLACNKILVERI